MDWFTFAIFAVFFGAVFLGIPMALSLVLGALIPIYLFVDINMVAIIQKLFVGIDMFAFMAIPLFIFCGSLLEKSGVSKKLCDFVNSLVGWVPGGVAIVTFVTCMFFGAISGSATATVLGIGSIMVPIMIDQGYEEKFALASIAIGGILGSIIPPSIPMVVFGMSSGAPISDLFLGGILPGVLMTTAFSIYSFIYGKKHVKVASKFELPVVWKTFKGAIWGLMMPFIILGGIYGGIFTPTEAAAVASVYGMFVGFLIYKNLNIRNFYDCLMSTVISSSMIMFIVACAAAYSYALTRQRIPLEIANIITALTNSEAVFLILTMALLLILGTFLETTSAILIVTPILTPIAKTFGIDLVAFGVLVCVGLAIGFVTPPMGLNLYVAARLRMRPIDYVINSHLFRLIVIAVAMLAIFAFVPEIIMLLPNAV